MLTCFHRTSIEYLLFQQTSWGGSLAKLPRNLMEFDCSYTLISGGLTNAVFAGLNRLKYVDVSGNFLNATVPKVLVYERGQVQDCRALERLESSRDGQHSHCSGVLEDPTIPFPKSKWTNWDDTYGSGALAQLAKALACG